MAEFSRRDIEEAKKRVREMQRKADSYIGIDNSFDKAVAEAPKTERNAERKSKPPEQEKSRDHQEQEEHEAHSEFIILVLLLLLSHEGADSKLLLALLYLLF